MQRGRCWIVIGLLTCLLGFSAYGQDAPRERRPPHDPEQRGGRADRGQRRGPQSRPFLPDFGGRLGQYLFDLAPAITEPLEPGEREALLRFGAEQFPRLHQALEAIRQRDPQLYDRKVDETIPMLRRLKRVYERSPRLAELVRAHMLRQADIERRMRALRWTAPGSPEHEQALTDVRAAIAESVEVEARTLEAVADVLDAQRAELVAEWAVHVLAGGVPDERLPEGVRDLLDAYRQADEAARTDIAERLRAQLGERLEAEAGALRTRAAYMQERADEIVQERLTWMIERADRMKSEPHRGRRRASD